MGLLTLLCNLKRSKHYTTQKAGEKFKKNRLFCKAVTFLLTFFLPQKK